jgi:hypothetical protein
MLTALRRICARTTMTHHNAAACVARHGAICKTLEKNTKQILRTWQNDRRKTRFRLGGSRAKLATSLVRLSSMIAVLAMQLGAFG